VFGGFFCGTGGNDRLWVGDGGGKVSGEEGAADCEVDGDGVLLHGGCEDKVNFGAGGEGGFESGMEGGFEVPFFSEAGGGTTGEVVVTAEAEGAGSARELVEAVEVKGVEGVLRGERLAGVDPAAFAGASEGGSGGDGGRRDA
jgi:hypothetical protein